MKKKLIEDKTFHTYIRLFWDCSEEEFVRYANKKNETEYEPNGAFGKTILHTVDKYFNVFIWVNSKKNYETLSHEILHIIRYWLQDFLGINMTEDTEEIYTMLHSFYMRECLKALK